MMAAPTLQQLQDLARAHGVGTEFWGFFGDLVQVEPATLSAVLTALGVPCESADDVDAALREADLAPWRHLVPPCVVSRREDPARFPVHVVDGEPVEVWVETEAGERVACHQVRGDTPAREVDGVRLGRAAFVVPHDVPLGWHELVARTPGQPEARSTLVVVPSRVSTGDMLPQRTGRERSWGVVTQLYSVRSRASWGLGDLADLGALAEFGGAQGADWILVNPLHAAEPMPPVEDSPYLPTTRRFFNPLYLRVEQIPEHAGLEPPAAERVADLAAQASADNADAHRLVRDPAYAAKLEALELVAAVPRSVQREADFAAFRAEHGSGLADFALWCALRELHGEHDPFWQTLSPTGPDAEEWRLKLANRIDVHCWMQWVLDEQLKEASQAAAAAGMGVGVVHDLAVGVHPRGADAWALQDVLVSGVDVGAPPDMYNQQGQNWSQPPWHPARLAAAGYRPFRDMLRTILRHAGGIRIDHVLGLFRLWWVPDGMPADQGSYVTYDHEALIGILCLEAERAGAVVIGEDLGTFEPWVRDYLAARGLLGTSILWFEYTSQGTPLPPEHYRTGCLACVNTHDLPPTAGYLESEHVAVRHRLGLLTRSLEEEYEADRREQQAVLGLCRERGLLSPDAGVAETVTALYRLLAAAPSVMQGVSLVDAVGERRIQNQPGTDTEYPNWQVPLADNTGAAVLVEDLPRHPRALELFRVVRSALGHES